MTLSTIMEWNSVYTLNDNTVSHKLHGIEAGKIYSTSRIIIKKSELPTTHDAILLLHLLTPSNMMMTKCILPIASLTHTLSWHKIYHDYATTQEQSNLLHETLSAERWLVINANTLQ